MTDKPSDSSNFSFRMFDLYRRFVEVLQLNPEYLEDFKNGSLSEETCHFVIKNVFQLRQTEEKTASYVNYLMRNSKIIAAHAEEVPNNWDDAINYTDQCIKIIRKYLKEKGISLKANFDFQSIKEIANDIAERLHQTPNESQIEAIKEYLKYDLRNPKKTIASISADKKSSTRIKKSRKTKDVDKAKVKKVKNNTLKMIIKKLSKETGQIQSDHSIYSNDSLQNSNDKITNEVSLEDSEIKEEVKNELAERECMKNIETRKSKIKHELLQNKNKETSLDNSYTLIEDSYKNGDTDNVALLQDSIKSENQANECTIMKVIKKTGTPYQVKEEINCNDSQSNHFELKRKNQDVNENDASSCVKKIFVSNDLLITHNDQYVTLTYVNDSNDEYEMVQLSDLDTARNETVYITADDQNIVEHAKHDDNSNYNEHNNGNESNLNAQDQSSQITKNQNTARHIKNISKFNFGELSRCDRCNIEQEIKYSSVQNMTYTEMLKLIETVLAFCELKHEISLEEFLILRRTRDKIHWRSLKEP